MRIGQLIKDSGKPFFSLEFFPPPSPGQLPAFYDMAASLRALRPLFVSVTYGAGGHKQQNTLDVTARLAAMGFTVMAHLTCVGAQPQGIDSFISRLLAHNVDNILALRGDPPKEADWDWNAGPFRHASDLVAHARAKFPSLGIGVAVYAAPHPESPSFAEDRRRAIDKIAAGADFAITQLFFDAREYMDLVENFDRAGVAIPVIPGILPIQSLASVKRVLSMCGANIPGKLFLQLEEAHASGGEEAVREAGFEFAMAQIRRLLDIGAPGIHLYTLNKSELCRRIIEESGLER